MTLKLCDAAESIDDANIPVNLFITRVKTRQGGTKYKLTFDNFMPRKGYASEGGIIRADQREELQQFIEEKILPLYKNAFLSVTALAKGQQNDFYYWNSPKNEPSEPDEEEDFDFYEEEDEEEDEDED